MKAAYVIYSLMGLGGMLTMWASLAGWGAAEPVSKPVSLREQSVRHSTGGYNRHYFVGGGIHHGK